jgi:hypothetical protein
MPTLHDYEIYDGTTCNAGTYVTGFSGENAACAAYNYTRNNPATVEFIIWERSADRSWVGPRPGRP